MRYTGNPRASTSYLTIVYWYIYGVYIKHTLGVVRMISHSYSLRTANLLNPCVTHAIVTNRRASRYIYAVMNIIYRYHILYSTSIETSAAPISVRYYLVPTLIVVWYGILSFDDGWFGKPCYSCKNHPTLIPSNLAPKTRVQ